jgi:nucleotide-binding universal stress UspA family protein
MEYSHILIATDGSALANHAVIKGLSLGKRLGARITTVTVSEPWSALEVAERSKAGEMRPIEEYEKEAAEQASRILSGVEQLAGQEGVSSELVHVTDQRPAEGILKVARDSGCDLIVMGTHGRRGLAKLFLGSQAAEVLAMSTIPVMICK